MNKAERAQMFSEEERLNICARLRVVLEEDRIRLLRRTFYQWIIGLCPLVEHAAVIEIQVPMRPRTPELWPEYPEQPQPRTMTPELWPDTDDGF